MSRGSGFTPSNLRDPICPSCRCPADPHPKIICELCGREFSHVNSIRLHSSIAHGLGPLKASALALRAKHRARGWPIGPLPPSLVVDSGRPSHYGRALQGGSAPSRPSCPKGEAVP